MALRNKTLIIISVTLAGLIGLLYFISQTILLSSFAELEDQGVRQNVERVSAALQDELTTLDSIAGDWAPWDDTYVFVEDQNEQFIENNLLDVTLINLELNYMLFLNTADQLVFSKAVDLQSGVSTDLSPSLQNYLANNKPILRHANPEDSLSGIIPLPDSPLLFASRPILTSN
ncbi:MAG TPA: CHASE4 domain-containing protein, partial [Anaerolineae bacterium]|nr:CHASE4 domain-containing protein [Anaerolineae bacterium]